MTGPVSAVIGEHRRLHLQHGPIDLIIDADGDPAEVALALAQAETRFRDVLPTLVAELPRLRSACTPRGLGLVGPVARRMEAAVMPHTDQFITPMAAVAGAVADEMLAALCSGRTLDRGYVNNGGDIAVALASGLSLAVGLVADPRTGRLCGRATIGDGSGVGGIATSGRHGRSLSCGIADAVTVLAANAAAADAAATLIANAVDLPDSHKIDRAPANMIDAASDLGDRAVVVDVARLSVAEARSAIGRGATVARAMQKRGLISDVALCLAGEIEVVGDLGQMSVDPPPACATNDATDGRSLACA